MFNLKSKIDARLEARRNGESGLALLDVLLGMAIFALIAVIAVQAMGQFRQRAYTTQVTSDVKQLATGIEAALTAPNATFTGVGMPAAPGTITTSGFGVNLTGSNVAVLKSGGIGNYVVCVENVSADIAAFYDASTGKVTGTGAASTC